MARVPRRPRRQSTDPRATALYGRPTDFGPLAAHCTAQGWQVEDRHCYSDLVALRAAVMRNAVERVVVARVSRLGDCVADVLEVADEMKRRGCALVSLYDPLDISTPTGWFALTLVIATAQLRAAEQREGTDDE